MDLVGAVHDASLAARDTTNVINQTTRDVKDSHVLEDTAGAIEETAEVANETAKLTKDTAKQIPKELLKQPSK